eukprot:2638863-Heterocapsa_arctica.AAC.1
MESTWKVGHVGKSNVNGKGRFGHCYEHMARTTKENEQGGKQLRVKLHTQSEQREKEFYHDKKWKYKKNIEKNQSDMEEVHRGMTADDINL